MSKADKSLALDVRDVSIETHILEHIASRHTGGSGESEYCRGRIQSMARELLKFRAQEQDKKEGYK